MRNLSEMSAVKALSERLSQYEPITRYDTPEEPQGWTIAWTLAEIEEFCETFQTRRLPTLLAAASEDETLDVLYEILEDYRRARRLMRMAAFYDRLIDDEDEPADAPTSQA